MHVSVQRAGNRAAGQRLSALLYAAVSHRRLLHGHRPFQAAVAQGCRRRRRCRRARPPPHALADDGVVEAVCGRDGVLAVLHGGGRTGLAAVQLCGPVLRPPLLLHQLHVVLEHVCLPSDLPHQPERQGVGEFCDRHHLALDGPVHRSTVFSFPTAALNFLPGCQRSVCFCLLLLPRRCVCGVCCLVCAEPLLYLSVKRTNPTLPHPPPSLSPLSSPPVLPSRAALCRYIRPFPLPQTSYPDAALPRGEKKLSLRTDLLPVRGDSA